MMIFDILKFLSDYSDELLFTPNLFFFHFAPVFHCKMNLCLFVVMKLSLFQLLFFTPSRQYTKLENIFKSPLTTICFGKLRQSRWVYRTNLEQFICLNQNFTFYR